MKKKKKENREKVTISMILALGEERSVARHRALKNYLRLAVKWTKQKKKKI